MEKKPYAACDDERQRSFRTDAGANAARLRDPNLVTRTCPKCGETATAVGSQDGLRCQACGLQFSVKEQR